MSCRCGIVRSVTVNVPSRSSVASPSHLKPSQRPQSTASTASSVPPLRSTGLSSQAVPLTPSRTVEELRELRELTGNDDGAQRVAWTDTWAKAKKWLSGKLAGTEVEEETDEAGNQWFTLRGASDRALLIGGHIDSVPNGGWLDGCLNVLAGVEVLRRLAEEGEPPLTVRLVNWADEEGARFGRSLFGSSAAAGSMSDQDELRLRKDADGVTLPDAIAAHGVDLDRALDARKQLENAFAYLELHIEQGPVLESMDLPLGVVLGTFGVERHLITWRGQAAHAGSTPMDTRRDALAGAAKLALEIRPIAAQVGAGAVCTSGGVVTKPGIVTSVVETAEQLLDQRHLDAGSLAELLRLAKGASERFAQEEDLEVEWARIWSIEPILFDAELIDLADESIHEVASTSHRLPSGPLHDAAEVARAGIPTVMLFVQSLRGLSHTKLEDTKPEHLELAVQALDRLAQKVLERERSA
ncbi:MAG: Zn-dependent hydrolase [Actinobacteria bacterium]|nr:Zn-dependent hydrolase [Actinomycetota bacterium]